MSDRCRDDWMWFALLLALFSDPACSCDHDERYEFGPSDDRVTHAPLRRRGRWRWWTGGAVAVTAVAVLWPKAPDSVAVANMVHTLPADNAAVSSPAPVVVVETTPSF